jgi:hypothetical protein
MLRYLCLACLPLASFVLRYLYKRVIQQEMGRKMLISSTFSSAIG